MCLARKPWLLVLEYMEFKDLGVILRTCKKSGVSLRLNELMTFPVQIAEACQYLTEVLTCFTLFLFSNVPRNELCTAT